MIALLLAALLPSEPQAELLRSTAAGERLVTHAAPRFRKGRAKGAVIEVRPGRPLQEVVGIGGALTEASAYVLAHLPEPTRRALLDRCFGPGGADLSMARIPIGACDFSVEGRWSYADVPGDTALVHFSLAPDRKGWAQAKDPGYALLPLVQDALRRRPDLRLVASPWTAPAWMKDNGDWYGAGRGGKLKPEHFDTFARYTVKYVQSMVAEGIRLWGLTPLNEPEGNGGQWESMEFQPEAMRDYIGGHLGPRLAEAGLGGVKVLAFDHNRDAAALRHADAVLGDPKAARFVWGTALHWYSTTNSACPEVLDALRDRFPSKPLVHTEGCIDGIGTPDSSPGGRFLGWQNPRWWWEEAATDWGYYWASAAEKPAHPKYAPVDRYARDLIQGLNHGLSGWIDWNLVLDRQGGPNHVKNFCAAPLMADPATGEVCVTPLWDVLCHFSPDLQPGSRVVQVGVTVPGCAPDDLHATAALSPDGRRLAVFIFNRSAREIRCRLQVGGNHASLVLPPRSLQTLRLPHR